MDGGTADLGQLWNTDLGQLWNTGVDFFTKMDALDEVVYD